MLKKYNVKTYLLYSLILVISNGILSTTNSKSPNPILFGNHRTSDFKIDSYTEFLDPYIFYNKYVLPGKPVLFKGGAKHVPAFKLWTDEYMRKQFGNIEVYAEHGKKENRNMAIINMTMNEFITKYNSSLEDYYLVTDLVDNMKDDVCLLRPFQCGGYDFDTAILWLSSGGTNSVFHYDEIENINCMIDGYKDIVFVDKKYAKQVESRSWQIDGTYYIDDIDSFDVNKYPELASVPIMNAHLDKGDCLYIPLRWYHVVRSSKGRNMAVNLWFNPILYYNDSRCGFPMNNENGIEEYTDRKNYLLKNCEPLNSFKKDEDLLNIKQYKYDLFEKCIGEEFVEKKKFIKLMSKNTALSILDDTHAEMIFSAFDEDKNNVLRWIEINNMNLGEFISENAFMRESMNKNEMGTRYIDENNEDEKVKDEL